MFSQMNPGFSDDTIPLSIGSKEGGFEPIAATISSQKGEQTVLYKDGSTYTGTLLDGLRTGHGEWKAASGSYEYEGQWRADLPDGQGIQKWSDGRTYHGGFSDGVFNGHGRMEWQAAQGLLSYEGQYAKDVKHGQGKFLWPDGRGYDGEWIHGKRSGKGFYINSKGHKKEGIWIDDKFDRWVLDDDSEPMKPGEKRRL